jgi:hypothetical protein
MPPLVSQRLAILASPLSELTGFCLAVNCLSLGCAGERTFTIAELSNFYGGQNHRRPGRAQDAAPWRMSRPGGSRVAGHRTSAKSKHPCPTAPGAAVGGRRRASVAWIGERCRQRCWIAYVALNPRGSKQAPQ